MSHRFFQNVFFNSLLIKINPNKGQILPLFNFEKILEKLLVGRSLTASLSSWVMISHEFSWHHYTVENAKFKFSQLAFHFRVFGQFEAKNILKHLRFWCTENWIESLMCKNSSQLSFKCFPLLAFVTSAAAFCTVSKYCRHCFKNISKKFMISAVNRQNKCETSPNSNF